ncbi:MAG: hypothetical protein AAFS10_10280, partial [Myxococcota bacterium]
GGAYNEEGELVYSAAVTGLEGDIDFTAAEGETTLVKRLALGLQAQGAKVTYNKATDTLGFDVNLENLGVQGDLDWRAASFVSRTGEGAWPHSTTGAQLKGLTAHGEVSNISGKDDSKEMGILLEGLHIDLLEVYDDNKAINPDMPGKSNQVAIHNVDVAGLEVIGNTPVAGTIDVASITAQGDTDRGALRAFQDKMAGFGIKQGAASLAARQISFSFENGTTHGGLKQLELRNAHIHVDDPAAGEIEGTLPSVMLQDVGFNYTTYEQLQENVPGGMTDDHWYAMDMSVGSLTLMNDANVLYTTASKYHISPERMDEVEEALVERQANVGEGQFAGIMLAYYDKAMRQLQDVRQGNVAFTPVTTQELWHFERTMAAGQQFEAKREDRQNNRSDRKENLKNVIINGRNYDIEAANKMDILTKELGLTGLFKLDLAAGAASDMDLVNYAIEAFISEDGLLTSVVPDYQEIFDDVRADFKKASGQGFWSGLWTGIKSIVSAGVSTVASSLTAPVIDNVALVFDVLFSLIPGIRRWVGNKAYNAAGGDGMLGIDKATDEEHNTMISDALAEQTGTYTGAGDYFAITDGRVKLSTKETTISFVSEETTAGGYSHVTTTTTLPAVSFNLDKLTFDNEMLRLSGMGAQFGALKFDRSSVSRVDQTSEAGLENSYLKETDDSASVGSANLKVSSVVGRTVAGANGEGLDQYDVTLAAGTNIREVEYSREERTFGKIAWAPALDEFVITDG